MGKKKANKFYNLVGSTNGQTLNLSINDDIGDFFGTTADDVAGVLAGNHVSDIDVDLNTNGGDVIDGISIRNQFVNHPATVTTRVTGQAASIGVSIFMSGNQRIMNKGSSLFVHPISVAGNFSAQELPKVQIEVEKLENSVADIVSFGSNVSREDVRTLMRDTARLTAEEALEMGFATSISDEESTTLTNYSEVKFLNYIDSKEKIQQVLNEVNLKLNNNKGENVMDTKEFDNKLADMKSEFNNQIESLKTDLTTAMNTIKVHEKTIVDNENTIVEMNNNTSRIEFSNFVDGLVRVGKALENEKEDIIQDLELRKDKPEMLNSKKLLLNSRKPKVDLSHDFANHGPDNTLNGKGASDEDKKAYNKLIATGASNGRKRK